MMSARRRREVAGVQPHNVIMHRTRIHKGVMVHHGHAVRHSLVNVSNVCDVIHGHVVVDVCDLGDIHPGIANIDILDIAWTGAVPRNEYFSGPQWKPSYPAPAADSDSDAKAPTANESHEPR